MTAPMDEQALRFGLKVRPKPLVGIKDTVGEWQLGTLGIAKTDPSFRSGWSFSLTPTAHFAKQWSDIDDRRGWAVTFRSGGVNGDFVAGWVPPEREAEADQWIAFLNAEIAARLAEKAARPTAT